MDLTVFTVFTSFLWVNFFMILTIFFRKQHIFYQYFSLCSLLLVVVLCILKVFAIVEFPFTIVVNSTKVMTTLQKISSQIVFLINIGNIEYNISIGYAFVVLSLLGSVILVYKKICRCQKICRFINFLPQSDNDKINQILQSVQNLIGTNKQIKIIVHNKVMSPAIIGHFHPTIILPELDFTNDELNGILTHEMMHCKYNHILIKLTIEFIKILLWWNPLVYIFSYEVNNIIEFHADEKLNEILNKQERVSYLEAIIKVMKNCRQSKSFMSSSIGLIENSSENVMKQRFIMISENIYSKNFKVKNLVFILLVLFMFIMSYMFVIQPFSEPTDDNYNDNAPVVTEDSYIVKNEDIYIIYDANGNEIAKYKGSIDEKYDYLKVKEIN